MAVYGFGSGSVFGYRTDVANPTPIQLGALQDVSVEFSFDVKELHGQFQFPLDTARANGKISGKASSARLDTRTWNELFFGQSVVTGGDTVSINESGTIPSPSGPYTITVANSANFLKDEGVYNGSTGVALTAVASGPTTGQYSVSAGVYTFAAADAGLAVKISYSYTLTTGRSILITNQLLGQSPTLAVTLTNQYKGKNFTLELYACTPTKWTFPEKLADYLISDWEFSAFADAAGNVGKISGSE